MKKVIVLCAVVLVFLVPAFLFAVGCTEEEICSKPEGADYYYIRFTLDGLEMDAEEIIILNFGHSDVTAENPFVTLSPDSNGMWLDGGYCFHMSTPTDVDFSMYGWLYPSTPGVYEGVYGGPGPSIGFHSIYLWITESGEVYYYHTVGGTITITTFGDVGGDVEGTFDITYESDNSTAPSYGSPLTAIGGFRLLRVSDEYYQHP